MSFIDEESSERCESGRSGLESNVFSCELSSKVPFYTFQGDEDDDLEHFLELRTVCLGDGAQEESNVVEVTALNHQGKKVSVPLANLHVCCLPMDGDDLPLLRRRGCGAGATLDMSMMKDPLKSLVPLPGPLVPTAGQHHPAVEKLKLTPEEQRRHNLPYIQVSLGEFELKAPVTLRLKSGSGPVTVSGFHLTAYESSEEEEEDEEEEIIPVKPAKKKQKL